MKREKLGVINIAYKSIEEVKLKSIVKIREYSLFKIVFLKTI